MIGVIDYGVGNLFSVLKALDYIGADKTLIKTPEEMTDCHGIILPGVGAFGDGINGLKSNGLWEAIKEFAISGRPLLGICLGMQFLLSSSEEFGTHKGLGLIPGRVIPIPAPDQGNGAKYKIPHIAWEKLKRSADWEDTIFENIREGEETYFVHSFMASLDDPANELSYVDYSGMKITSAIKKGNIYGCQFHIEKSRETGLTMLKNFNRIVDSVSRA